MRWAWLVVVAACSGDDYYRRYDAADWAGTWSDSLHTVLIEACSPSTVAFTFDGRLLLGDVDENGLVINPQDNSWWGGIQMTSTIEIELDLQIDFGFTNMYWVTQTIPDDGRRELCE